MFHCTSCSRAWPIKHNIYVCPSCAGPLTIIPDLNAVRTSFDRQMVQSRGPGVWKYFELFPLNAKTNIISLGEGGTFLQKCHRLSKVLGVNELYVKNETTNPTGSFIDRGMTVLVSKAIEADVRSLSCIPTGNLGASLAAYAAKAGIQCQIQLSSEIDLGKLYQMIAYNADIQLRDDHQIFPMGDRHDVLVSPSNPFLIEGEKTIAYEVCEQLDWQPPSHIISPMGTGGLTSMIWKGLQEFTRLGLIDRPASAITGVQAEGCCPIVTAYQNHRKEIEPIHDPTTLAIDIQVGNPSLGKLALKAVRDSKGTAIAVSDHEILEAVQLLAKTEGVFAEPSAAATIAGLRKLTKQGAIAREEVVVCIITGAGLKDPSIMEKLVEGHRRVKMFVHGVQERGLTRLGDTKLRILRILSERELHGYGIWKTLNEDPSVKITIPSIYQHLAELAVLNLVRKGEGQPVVGARTRRYYALTDKGRDALRLKP